MSDKKHVFDNPKNVKRVIHWLYVACAVVFVADFFVERDVNHPWESLFGFYGIYGFIAFSLLVLVSKELRKVLMRREDYYDK